MSALTDLELLREVGNALTAARPQPGEDIVEGVQRFDAYLTDYEARGGDLTALLEWGHRHLLCDLAEHEWLGYFDVLFWRHAITDDMLVTVLKCLMHRSRYTFLRTLSANLSPDADLSGLCTNAAHFTGGHDDQDVADRVDLLRDFGLLDLADQKNQALDALILVFAAPHDIGANLRRLRILVEKGMSAAVFQSLPLRFTAWQSDDIAYADFFLAHGADLAAAGYEAIFGALRRGNKRMAVHLFRLSGATVDDLKPLAAFYDDIDWTLLDYAEKQPDSDPDSVAVAVAVDTFLDSLGSTGDSPSPVALADTQ